MELVKKIIRVINFINNQMYFVIGGIIVFLSIIVFYDVVARYFFNASTSFGFDTATWLTALAALLGGGHVQLKDEHIRVDILYEKFSDRKKSIVDLITHFFILVMVITLIWFGGSQVLNLYEQGSVASSGLNIPLWIKWTIIPIGGFLLGLQMLVTLFMDLYFLITGQKLEGVK